MEKILRSPSGKISSKLLIILVAGFAFALIASNHNFFRYFLILVEGCNRDELALLLVSLMYLSFVMEISPFRQFIRLKKGLKFSREEENDSREKDKLYRALFEESGDAIILSDGKRILEINKKSCEVFGFKPEHPCNLSLISFVPGKYLPEFQQALREVFTHGFSLFEMEYTKPDGNFTHMELSLSLINKKTRVIQIVSRDITDLKKAEKLEQESRERLKAVLDNTLCGILLIEASTRKIVDANPVAMRAVGYSDSEKELLGKAYHQLIGPVGENRCALLPQDQSGDLPENLFFNIEEKDIPMLRSVVPVSIGGNGYFVESFVDLSGSTKYK